MFTLTIPAISCGHCVKTVTEVVHRVDPAATVQADPVTKEVRIESRQPASAFTAPLAEEGYPPKA